MKAAVLVCMMAATALAAPTYKRTTRLDPKLAPEVSAAEQAWSAAEREPDRAKQLMLWEQAAAAFGEVDGAAVDDKVKREAAYAAILAWRNAQEVDPTVTPPALAYVKVKPRPLPARDVQLIAALDRYAKYAEPSAAELPGVLFLKGRTYARFDQLEAAIPILALVLERHRTHEVAEHAANLLLDSYHRLKQYDRLVALADELAKDAALIKRFPTLGETVRKIQAQARRKEFERLSAQARADPDLDTWSAVGKAYLELYNANPKGADGDELLYNAGVAFEEGRATGAAIQAFTLLRRQHARSKLAPRALARLGRIYGNIAQYDKAAEALEEYAKRYAAEKDAYDAMSDAIYFRKALGDRAAAIENTRYLIKTYGAKKPRESAEAFWSLTALYDADPAAAVAHLREYLRVYRGKSEPGRVVIAHAKLGSFLWKESCPHAGIDGLCVKMTNRAGTCSPDSRPVWTVTSRQAGKRKDALAAFVLAVTEYERRGVPDDPVAAYHHAQARLALADAELEAYLTLAFPVGLNFDPADAAKQTASMKRFQSWFETMRTSGGKIARAYETVLATREPASSITAAARLGIVTDSLATRLVTGEVPRDVSTGPHAADKHKDYCAVLKEAAEPLAHRALEAYGVCLLKSTELSWFGASSAYCERELIRRMPGEYPAAPELRAHATFVAPVLASEPPTPR